MELISNFSIRSRGMKEGCKEEHLHQTNCEDDILGCHHDHSSDNLSYRGHLAAGAVAGIIEHCLMYPVDTIKTRMQVGVAIDSCSHSHSHSHSYPKNAKFPTMSETLQSLLKVEGAKKLFRGITAMALGSGPSHAVYFASYEQSRKLLGADTPGHHPISNGISGIVATVSSETISTPMDTIKQRMQVQNSPYKTMIHAIKTIKIEEGIGAFFSSFNTTLLMRIPFSAIHFSLYHTMKEFMKVDKMEINSVEFLISNWICGGFSGAFAAVLTNPLDVMRTSLQLQGLQGRKNSERRFSGIKSVAKEIIERDGIKGFTRGWLPRMIFYFPGAAICWTTYEACKGLFSNL